MGEEVAKQMFEALREYMGQKVKCVYIESGTTHVCEDMLHGLRDFLQVKVGPSTLPFVGAGLAIVSISTNESVLYFNPFVKEGYKGFDGEMERIAQAMFGEGKTKAQAALIRGELKPTKEEVIADYQYALKYYISRGKDLIQGRELQNEWAEACKHTAGDYEGIKLLEMVFEIMRMLPGAENCEEVIESIQNKFNPSEDILALAVQKAAYYSPRGPVLLQYWNALYTQPDFPDEGPKLH